MITETCEGWSLQRSQMMISNTLNEGIADVAIVISHKFAFYKINHS